MPALVFPLLGFVIGLGLARIASGERGSTTESRDVVLAACFGAVLLGPTTAFLFALSPDWCLSYRVDSRRLPGFFPALLALGSACGPVLGVVCARALSWSRRPRLLWQLFALTLGSIAALLLVGSARLGRVASYTQFHDDFGVRPVAGSPLGYALLWLFSIVAVGVALTARGIRRHHAAVSRD
ncbi:MAG TPA: hypothetical protein PKA88_25780 [Polyangiaceae bacterium]|nr:hypothetical protein [Polyangiaceae bacterium]HMR77853.1 hypothetical protein [Polyangiaceae bacterium]